MPAPTRNLWAIVGHLVHTIVTQGCCIGSTIIPTTLLVYRSAIYPQGMTLKYGLGGRLRTPVSRSSGRPWPLLPVLRVQHQPQQPISAVINCLLSLALCTVHYGGSGWLSTSALLHAALSQPASAGVGTTAAPDP